DTPFVGTLPLMVPPATERTTQVLAMSILGIREKPNPAVSAANDATLKLRMGLQGAVQRGQILLDKRPGAILLGPIRLKRENLLNGDDKKARLSVIMLIVLSTPSSYFREANASRGRTRFFVRYRQTSQQPPAQTIHCLLLPQAILFAKSAQTRCPSRPEITTWKEEEASFFPSSGPPKLSRDGSIQMSGKEKTEQLNG